MKKIDWKILIITCIFCLLPILLGVAYYDDLPEQVAIHFDINNNPDNYFIKPLFVYGFPVFMLLVQMFCAIVIDVSDKHREANRKISIVSKWIIPILSILLYTVTLLFNMNYLVDIRVYVMLIIGIMFMVIGNYIPKTVGTAYNKYRFKDEGVQKRLNKMIGYTFIIFGVMLIISVFFMPIISAIVVAFCIFAMIVFSIYGYYEDKKAIREKNKNKM